MTAAEVLLWGSYSMEEELYTAVSAGDEYSVKLLIQDGADVCWRRPWPSDGECVLHEAALRGNVPIIEELIRGRANLEQVDDRGRTAMHTAANAGHTDVIHRLHSLGGNVNKADFDGVTPLHLACAGNHPQTVKCLLQAGAQPNRNGNEHYSSPLNISAMNGHLECVKVLLEHGANVNWSDQYQRRATHGAAANGYEDCLSYLVRHGAAVDPADSMDGPALFQAAEQEHSQCVDVLVVAGADVVAAAAYASTRRQWRTVEVLLGHIGEQVGHPGADDRLNTLLLAAIKDVRLSVVARCVRCGGFADAAAVAAALVVPVSRRGQIHAADVVEESWLEYVYTADRLQDLHELLGMLYEMGLIAGGTYRRQLDALSVGGEVVRVTPVSLKNMCAGTVRGCVRQGQGRGASRGQGAEGREEGQGANRGQGAEGREEGLGTNQEKGAERREERQGVEGREERQGANQGQGAEGMEERQEGQLQENPGHGHRLEEREEGQLELVGQGANHGQRMEDTGNREQEGQQQENQGHGTQRQQQGQHAYELLGLPQLLIDFVSGQPFVDKYQALPPVTWDEDE